MHALMLGLALAASSQSGSAAVEGFQLIHVSDLQQLLTTTPDRVAVFDANDADFRHTNGVIPQASLLSSSSTYDVQATLPADKSEELVFYCANQKCMASHAAAKRAVEAGYPHVAVLSDGLMGWKDAGKPVKKL